MPGALTDFQVPALNSTFIAVTSSCRATVRWVVHSNGYRQFVIPAPRPPFRVEVQISPTFVPADLDPSSSERRPLGAQVGFGWVAKPPKAAS